jgi:uncharacterized membrane protein
MNPWTITIILRWVHVIAGAAWLGEVVVVNFILLPTLVRLDSEKRNWFLETVFPQVFRLASVLSLLTILAGAALNLSLSGWQLDVALNRLVTTRWGWSILIGGALGLALTLFHLFIESSLEPLVIAAGDGLEDPQEELVLRRLHIIPRMGLGVLLLIFLLMMVAVRGI